MTTPADRELCGGAAVNVIFSGSPGGLIHNWTNDNPAIGLGASGTGNIIFTAANVAADETATITVIPEFGPCFGEPVNFTITIHPLPIVNQPADQVVCSGEQVNVVFTGSGNPDFDWTNSNPAIGLSASGSGDLDFTATGGPTVQTATITVLSGNGDCSGTSKSFTITVNPISTVTPVNDMEVCQGEPINVHFTGSPAGTTYSWTNDNTVIGLPATGSGDIVFSSSNVGATETANIQVTPSGSCPGAPIDFTITVNPIPEVAQPGNQTLCGGEAVSVLFSGTGNFDWTNSNPGIGLPASGSGDINFTAANPSTVQLATITVTPTDVGSCPGAPRIFTITVNPAPSVTQPADKQACAGELVTVLFNSSPIGTNNVWTNDNPAIGLPATGSGNIAFFSANVISQQIANITVTPQFGSSCPGLPQTFVITIDPIPTIVQPPVSLTYCGGENVVVPFSGTGSPEFQWTNNNPSIGLAASGTGDLDFTAALVNSTQIATITVTPLSGPCPGSAVNFKITVQPAPTVNAPPSIEICSGVAVNIPLTGPFTGTLYDWVNDNPAIGLPASGSGNMVFTSANVTNQETGTIVVTPKNSSCIGPPVSFTITVNPKPTVNQVADKVVCAGDPVNVLFSGNGNP
ncbi:MAG: PKD-like domain-containing protein, partial [Saprospiraceae bacterium]